MHTTVFPNATDYFVKDLTNSGPCYYFQDVLDEWLLCQRQWLYLEPIFSSEDINRQLPVESKRYQTMERLWRKIMKNAKDNPQV